MCGIIGEQLALVNKNEHLYEIGQVYTSVELNLCYCAGKCCGKVVYAYLVGFETVWKSSEP